MAIKFTDNQENKIQNLYDATLDEINKAKVFFAENQFSKEFGTNSPDTPDNYGKFYYTAQGLETIGLDMIKRHYREKEIVKEAWQKLLWPAYRIRRSLNLKSENNLDILVNQVIDGIMANRQPELRFDLTNYDLSKPISDLEKTYWNIYLYNEVIRAFFLLVRKNGYKDLEMALQIIKELQDLQLEHEKKYLENYENVKEHELQQKISIVIALYNLARSVEITGEFLSGKQGQSSKKLSSKGIKGEIDKYILNARESLSGGYDRELRILIKKIGEGCKKLVDSSVFAITLPRKIKSFLTNLSEKENNPVLELWYSQREAIKQSLLDPTKSAIVVSMPTSSGKTLLAKFSILQSYYQDPESKIVYLAPTKALVTQISLSLKRDLGKDLKVRVATPTYEINPVEDEMLNEDFDILVTTPEKMDLLVKTDHKSVSQISLLIVDEAHNINDKHRGAKLELLLATLRRERTFIKFLLLTPFATNAPEVSYWLGEEQGVPITLDWKPNDRLVGTVQPGRKIRSKPRRKMSFVTLDSAHSDFPADEELSLGECSFIDNQDFKSSKKRLSLYAALKWSKAKDGGILLLASSRKKAEDRAEWLSNNLPEREVSKSVDLVCRFLETEIGCGHELTDMIKKGVAFHHAGLPPEARYFIERLVEEKEIKILCATTTLAQGVHFPLSVVIIEQHFRQVNINGRWNCEDLKPWEFWNIAGRAGRALEDSLGVVAFATTNNNQRSRIQEYLRDDATIISSTLMELIDKFRDYENIEFKTTLLNDIKSASAFLQYIVHVLSISGIKEVRDDLEGILRSSFVFEEARSEHPELADVLIRIARLYITQLEEKKGKALSSYVNLADGTGFSSPSVDILWGQWKKNDKYGAKDWEIDKLIDETGSNELLAEAIETLGRIPEINLGSELIGEFGPERIARITKAWINGKSISEIADSEYSGNILKCTHHIYSKISNLISWGIRGIQRVTFLGEKDVDFNQLDLFPAMIYHGVRSEEAIAMRMLNVPRTAAEGLAEQWRKENIGEVSRIGDWLSTVEGNKWREALPDYATIDGEECKRMWEVLDGKRSWKELFEE